MGVAAVQTYEYAREPVPRFNDAAGQRLAISGQRDARCGDQRSPPPTVWR